MVKEGVEGGPIRSMTGFGRAEEDGPGGTITVEIRSLNHRYLEIGLRAPREFLHLDQRLRRAVKSRCARGKVDVFITLEERPGSLTVDLEHARQAAQTLAEIAHIVNDSVRLEHLLTIPEVFQKESPTSLEGTAEAILSTTEVALDNLVRQREEEGHALAEDLLGRTGVLEGLRNGIADLARLVPEKAVSQMEAFLEGLELGTKVDSQRLEAEIALMAQRADVTEELTRLAAHLDSLRGAMREGGTVGRRIDFIVQEIHREINTIGSKAATPEVSSLVVDFKTELEKLREQVQNIE